MRSLRVRLIVLFALTAVIPLAVTTVLLSRRIRDEVRSEARERLDVTLETLERSLAADGAALAGRLEILGDDPALKRLALDGRASAAPLGDYLAEKRFLLGLDFLFVTDTSGVPLGDAALAPFTPFASAGGGDAVPATAVPRPRGTGRFGGPRADAPGWLLGAAAGIAYREQSAGVLVGGIVLDAARLERLGQASGVTLTIEDEAGAVRVGVNGDSMAGAADSNARDFILALGPPAVRLVGRVSTAEADRTLADFQRAAIVLGVAGLALAVVIGVLGSLQVSRPVERLARFSERIARGEWEEPLALRSVGEIDTLVRALERMRVELRDYRDRLRASERQAAWGQMARKVAHEIKNPLTPIAVSVSDLKRSYEQGRPEFPEILDQAARIVGEEVQALKRLLGDFTELGRFPEPRLAPCDIGALFADLEALYAREVREGRLTFLSPAADLTLSLDREQVRRALVNLIQNGLEAAGEQGRVRVAARARDGALEIEVADDGPGLDAEAKARLFTPDFTTKAQGSGLGLVITERIVIDHGGAISVDSEPGRGATFTIRLPLDGKSAGR